MTIANRWLWIALVVPFAFFVPWMLIDHVYPVSDPSSYIEHAHRIYVQWRQDGWVGGLPDLYTIRMWRPIFYPTLGTLALVLTGGHVLWAVRLLCMAFYALLLGSSYACFGLVLPPAASALATILIGLLPWSFTSAHTFGLETPALAACVGALYWLIRARNLTSVRGAVWLGLWWAFALCLRPVETLVFFFVPVTAWVGLNLRAGRLRAWEVAGWVVTTLPFAVFFFRPQWLPQAHVVRVLAVVVVPMLWMAARRRLKLNEPFAWVMFLAFVLPAIWFAPYLPALQHWIHEGAFSEASKAVTIQAGEPLVVRFGRYLCGWPAVPVALAAVLAWRPGRLPKATVGWLGLLALTAVFPVALETVSDAPCIRYFYGSAFAAFAFALYLALTDQLPWRAPRRLLVGLAVGFCAVWCVQTMTFPETAPVLLPESIQMEFYLPIPVANDPAEGVMKELASALPPGPQSILMLLDRQVMTDAVLYHYSNLWVLHQVAKDLGHDWEFKAGFKPDAQTRFALFIADRQLREFYLKVIHVNFPDWRVIIDTRLPEDGVDGVMLVAERG